MTLRINLLSRVFFVVLVAGVLTLGFSTVAVVLLVEDDKEAALVDSAMQLAELRRDAIRSRLQLARAQLRSAAFAASADRLVDVPAAADGTTTALLGWRGEREIFEAASDEEAIQRLRSAERAGIGPARIEGLDALVSSRAGDIVVLGLVPLGDLVDFPAGWSGSIDMNTDDDGLDILHAERTDSTITIEAPIEGAYVLRAAAPLEPARAAAFLISKRVMIASVLVVIPLFLLAWLLARGVTFPIRLLLRSVQESGEMPLRAPALPNDEVGDLGRAIEEMSLRIHRDATALQRALVLDRKSAEDERQYLRCLAEELCVAAGTWEVIEAPLHVEYLTELGVDSDALLRRAGEARRTDEQSEGIQVRDGVFVVPLHDGARDYGLAIGRHVSREDVRAAELLTRTALGQLRNARLEREARVSEKLAVLSRLSASVAHEMNTPLAFVNANLLAIQDEPLTDDVAEMVADAHVGVQRLVRIVHDLSAVSAGGREAFSEKVRMVELLNSMARMAHSRRPNGRVEVVAPDDVWVSVDRGRLEQVVLNLLNNALDAAGDGGDVRVEAAQAKNVVVVDVIDSGQGIAPGVRGRLFEAFNTSKGANGTGLGLYISRSLIEAHGGTLELLRSGEAGTTFRLTLPVDSTCAARARSLDPGARPRVLIIDDDAAVVRSMQRWLKKRADVEGTTDPHEGLLLLGRNAFDLVLCDMNMPGFDGREIIEVVRAEHPQLLDKFVILTGSASEPPPGVRSARKPLDTRLLDELLGDCRAGGGSAQELVFQANDELAASA